MTEIIAWIFLGSFIYGVGLIGAGLIEQSTCDRGWQNHRNCSHPFQTPAPTLWPLVLAFAVILSPLLIPLFAAFKAVPWLAGWKTRAEERRQRLEIERDERIRHQRAEIDRLERELAEVLNG